MLYKLKLHKIEVDIKWNQKQPNQGSIILVQGGHSTVNGFSNFCGFH